MDKTLYKFGESSTEIEGEFFEKAHKDKMRVNKHPFHTTGFCKVPHSKRAFSNGLASIISYFHERDYGAFKITIYKGS